MAERTQRLDFRLTAANRRLIERAALHLGQPITTFAVKALVQEAERVIAQETQRKLTAREWSRFTAILDDASVAPALGQAVKQYRKRTLKSKAP